MFSSDEREYAHSRMHGSLFKLKNEERVMSVEEVHGGCGCLTVSGIVFDKNLDAENLELKITDLELAAPKIGLTKNGSMLYNVQRKPMRRDWRLGLRENNIMLTRLPDQDLQHPNNGLIIRAMLMQYVDLKDENALKVWLNSYGGRKFIPLSRHLYAEEDGSSVDYKLHHTLRGRVGSIVNGKIVLKNKHKNLSWGF